MVNFELVLGIVSIALLGLFVAYSVRSSFQLSPRESIPLMSAPASSVTPPPPPAIVVQDERAFIIAHHKTLGFLILYAFKKKKGGRHGQLPGGKVDPGEMREMAAVRELKEETGLVIPYKRLKLFKRIGSKSFFELELNDSDAVQEGGTHGPIQFRVKLSDEHVDVGFIPTAAEASLEVRKHSGGTCSLALERLSALRGE